MVIITEEIDLPTASPKSFGLPIVSPTNTIVKSPRSPLSLTLRRVNVKSVTPDTNSYHKAKGSSIYSASTRKHRSPSNIEQMQKMQDEFYEPKKKEEELEDGELPSLSRTNPRRPVAYWNQDELAVSVSKRPITSTRRPAVVHTNNSPNSRDSERIKVAGFWSQLDEEEEEPSDNERDKLSIRHYDDEPDDERRWRHSQSPVRPPAEVVTVNTEESEETEKDTSNPKGGQWNLMEQAACFREKEDATVDQQSANGSNQSLDRTYRTDSESRTEGVTSTIDYTHTTATDTNTKEEEEEEQGMFHCLTDALGTICGYSTYVSSAEEQKKERAMAIIQQDQHRREGGEVTKDSSYESEYEEMSEEEAAIELEYLSKEGDREPMELEDRDYMSENVVVAGVMGVAGGMAVATSKAKGQNESTRMEEVKSPKSEKKKRLTVKAVKNLLGLRKKKEVVNEETPNLAVVMATSAKAGVGSTVAPSSPVEHVKDGMPEMEDVDDEDDSIFTEDEAEEEPEQNPTQEESTLGGLNSYHNQEESTIQDLVASPNQEASNRHRSIFDEEELQSQAAGWDTNRKNSYLRELAQRAKQEYAQKKSMDYSDPDLTAGVGASMGAVALGTMMKREAPDARSASPTSVREDTSVAESKSSYNVDYNSFSPVEKRKFLRLLNSGVSPQEATRMIADEREEPTPMLEDAEEEDVDADVEGDEEGYDYESQEEGSYDSPGSVLEGESGESAKPSVRDAEEETRDVSRSENATAGGNFHDAHLVAAGVAGAAAALAVPAIVRAKSKKSPGQQGYEEDDVHQQEEVYQRGSDGLVSVGDKYYDSLQTSYEQEDVDNTLLLDGENGKRSKKISKKPSVSTSFAKVASRRSIVSPRSSSNKFTSVEGSVAQQHFSRPNGSRSVSVQDDEPVDVTLSPRFEASASRAPKKFNFMHRSSKWAKLGSNLDSDVVATQTVEAEQEEFYSPRSVPVQVEDTRSPISIPDNEITPGSAHTYGRSPISASSGYESQRAAQPPSTKASHVALPSLLPAIDSRERNVVTPTNEMAEDDRDEMFSPAHSAMETASRANSLFMSPDTLSPTSPHDFGSVMETPASQHDQEETEGIDRESPYRPVESPAASQAIANSSASRSLNVESQKPPTPRSTSSSPANQMPLIPNSPTEYASPHDTDGHSITNYSLTEQSFVTLGTAWTTASKSSRRRHKGAAGKRLLEAKEAESHAGPKSKGWMGSIRDVAAKREQVWDPEKGWQDYTEPEPSSKYGEIKPIGSLYLTEKIAHRKPDNVIVSRATHETRGDASVDFPEEWAAERKNMLDLVDPQAFAAVDNSSLDDAGAAIDEKSVFTNDTSAVDTSADTTSLLQNGHAPMRRTKPKKQTADKRKAASTAVPAKTVGWKESMEAATSQMNDELRQWNYEEGWVENNDFADDVSELTRTTLERSPGNEMQSSPSEAKSPVSPAYFLPSVAEEITESNSQLEAEAESEAEDRAIQEITNRDSTVREGTQSTNSEYEDDEEEEYDVDQMILDENRDDSDKENELSDDNVVSEDDYSEDASPKLATEEFPLSKSKHDKPPLPKRSLNQWLERSQIDNSGQSPDVESENAVNSRETHDDSLDDFQVDEKTTTEINVVRERCDENDKDLFKNDFSDIQLDSSISRDLVMESFESANSSENEWLASLSPNENDTDNDENNVSSRAMAWMSSMEKKSSSFKPTVTQSKNIGIKVDPERKKLDPPQNLDPPSIVSDRVTTKRIQSRYSSGTLSSSNATTPISNQNIAPKSRVEELISKLENPSKQAQSSQSDQEEEHDVIFHSSAMGIRLKRGDDGLVRVVSVTESSPGSSIVRDGQIEPDDILREAAGADLRSPITNSQWGEVVQIIRNASRPMKFVVVSARKTQCLASPRLQEEHNQLRSIQQTSTTQKPPQILFGGDDSVGSSYDDDSTVKQSLFNRIAQCAVPEKSEKSVSSDGNEVPMAHLAFLRTNPTIARVRNEASRRYPALCGRPDTIFEEPEDAERQLSQRPSSMDQSYDGSAAPTSITGNARTGTSVGAASVASNGSGDNVAYLDRISSKSAVSNKPARTWNNKANLNSTGRSSPPESNEVGWPEGDGQVFAKDFDAVSSYSSKSQSSFQVPVHKREAARQAELFAESKVVAMMEHELQYMDSAEECEI